MSLLAVITSIAISAAAPTVPKSLSAPGHTTITPRAEAATVTGHEAAEHIEWGYTGATGPDHWAEMSPEYGICSRGQQESPVDLKGAVPAALGKLVHEWKPVPLRVANNGHTVQVEAPAGSTFSTAGKTYSLAQFHLHHPSEHLLDGRRFPLELHFVHRGTDGVLGVIGVFAVAGRANPTLQAVLDAMPRTRGATSPVTARTVNIDKLLPRGAFYRYEGSLTTPPCSESVDWVVMRTPIEASATQIDAFEKLYPYNARPVQPLNRRFLLRSE